MRSPACSRMSTEGLIERRVLARAFGEVGTASHEERSDVVVCKSMATQPGPVIDPGGWARDNKRTTNMMNRVKRYPVSLRLPVVSIPLTSMSRRTSDLPGKGEGGAVSSHWVTFAGSSLAINPVYFPLYSSTCECGVFVGSVRLSCGSNVSENPSNNI